MALQRSSPLTPELMLALRRHFRLDWQGVHGVSHWSRVLTHGRYLAQRSGAAIEVVEMFAVLHDVERMNDGVDAEHGPRAAEYAHWLQRQGIIALDRFVFATLQEALRGHSHVQVHENVTVQACWDADRLDLGRVGTYPDYRRLGLAAAQDPVYIDQAYAWSQQATTRRTAMKRLSGHE